MVRRTQRAYLAMVGKASLEKQPMGIWVLVKVLLPLKVSQREGCGSWYNLTMVGTVISKQVKTRRNHDDDQGLMNLPSSPVSLSY